MRQAPLSDEEKDLLLKALERWDAKGNPLIWDFTVSSRETKKVAGDLIARGWLERDEGGPGMRCMLTDAARTLDRASLRERSP